MMQTLSTFPFPIAPQPSNTAQHTTAHSTQHTAQHTAQRAVLGRGPETPKDRQRTALPARPEETTKNSPADGRRNHSPSVLSYHPTSTMLLIDNNCHTLLITHSSSSGYYFSRYSRCGYALRLRAIDAPPLVTVDSMSCRDRQDVLLGYLRLTAKHRQQFGA